MRSEKIFDLVVWLFIASVGLFAAYVCFGILSSQASGRYQQYSVGGAIAGALISWSVLLSVYLQLRGSSNELQDLRKRTEELQSKLIRGAPRPKGFDTEVDERQRIVLARPKDWEPKGGTIFELELPDEKMIPNDNFAATFRCYFIPIEKGSKQTREAFHTKQLNLLKEASPFVQSYSHEVVRIGGEAGEVESLKMIVHQVARIEIKKSLETGRRERTWGLVSWKEFVGQIDALSPAQVAVGYPITVLFYGSGFRKGVVCYVNNKKRETEVIESWQAKVTLTAEDVAVPGILELVVENPDTKGKQSNTKMLVVADAPKDNPVAAQAPVAEDEKQVAVSAPVESTAGGDGASADTPKAEEPRVVFQEVVRMQITCYHEALEKIYFLEFWDDLGGFLDSSAVFNRILASTRFLN